MRMRDDRRSLLVASLVAAIGAVAFGVADAERPIDGVMTTPANRPGLGCGTDNAAAVPALQRRARLAGFYDHFVALIGTRVVEWTLDGAPRVVFDGARHVAVAKLEAYAIDGDDRLLSWMLGRNGAPALQLEQVALASAGVSGVLAIRCDGSLWQRKSGARDWQRVADAAIHAWVGDSSDYYINDRGALYASGLAHRGQYGDGKLTAVPGWTQVAERASFVVAHTGHAVFLRGDGAVLGTGGNRFGPLSTPGLGDKADRRGVIFDGAAQIATGSRNTLALRADGVLWGWGGADGVEPKRLADGITAIAAGNDGSVAIGADGTLWSWRVGKAPARVPPLR